MEDCEARRRQRPFPACLRFSRFPAVGRLLVSRATKERQIPRRGPLCAGSCSLQSGAGGAAGPGGQQGPEASGAGSLHSPDGTPPPWPLPGPRALRTVLAGLPGWPLASSPLCLRLSSPGDHGHPGSSYRDPIILTASAAALFPNKAAARVPGGWDFNTSWEDTVQP